jgi:hypothetical protein
MISSSVVFAADAASPVAWAMEADDAIDPISKQANVAPD